MGLETLDGFRDSVNLALGEKAQFNERLDRWINDGLQELFVMLDLEARRTCQQITTVDGTEKYTLPANLVATLVLTDRTNRRRLLKTSIENFEQLDPNKSGQPKTYARVDRSLYLNPVPDGAYLIHMFYIKEPDQLTAGTDVSELTAAYDRVIHLLAVRSALIDLGQHEKATFFFQVAQNRLRQIPNEFELEGENPAETIQIATSRGDLTDPPSVLR